MQENLIKGTPPSHAFEFRGDGGSYFLICLVNSLLVLVTLGIYLPWALMKCRRYIYSNMTLNGQPFAWKVTGGDVFLSWFMLLAIYIISIVLISMDYPIAGALVIGLLLLAIPVLIVKSLQFQALMTSLNNVRFGFHCSLLKAYWTVFFLPMLMLLAWAVVFAILLQICPVESVGEIVFTVILLGLFSIFGLGTVSGVTYSRLMTLVGQGGNYGIHRFTVQVNVWHCIKSAMLALAALAPFLLVVGLIAAALIQSIAELDVSGMSESEIEALIIIEYQRQYWMCQIIYYLGIGVTVSYMIVAFRNHFLNNLQLAKGQIRFRSTLTFHGMVYRMGGLYVLSAITAGLAYPLLRMWLIAWLAKNTYVVGDLDALELTDSDERVDGGVVSRLSRGIMPTFYFM